MSAVDTEGQATHINGIFGQTENVYVGGTYSYYSALGH
jgi:hypothetical protein